jgi:hypothetical protein
VNRQLRKAVVQISMVVTMATSAAIAIPLVNKHSQQRTEQAVKASSQSKVDAGRVFTAAIYPQLYTVAGCAVLALVVGFIVAKKLPRSESSRKQPKRR